jgi:hypothetical protein
MTFTSSLFSTPLEAPEGKFERNLFLNRDIQFYVSQPSNTMAGPGKIYDRPAAMAHAIPPYV